MDPQYTPDEETELPKVEVKFAPGRVDSATFFIRNEDHTLGNSLRYILMKNPDVDFAGYSVPHPSDPVMNLRVQTRGGKPSSEVLQQGITDLKSVLNHMLEVYNSEVETRASLMEE